MYLQVLKFLIKLLLKEQQKKGQFLDPFIIFDCITSAPIVYHANSKFATELGLFEIALSKQKITTPRGFEPRSQA